MNINTTMEDYFPQLIKKHEALLKKKSKQELSLEEASEILREIRESGSIIEDFGQRKLLQSYATLWGLFIYENTTPSQFPLTSLEEFSKKKNKSKASRATGATSQNFYGRQEELAHLSQWILEDSCHVVGILGIGGIGKTALALQLVEEIKNEFEYVFVKSLITAPYAENIFNNLIKSMSDSSPSELPKDVDGQISLLLDYFKKHRCLLLLDNFETVLETDKLTDTQLYEQRYRGYRELIQRVAQAEHQSCLLLTSREEPSELKFLKKQNNLVRSLPLEGLPLEEAIRIFESKGLSVISSDINFQEIVNYYQGNPLVLKIVSTEIKDNFGGDLAEFLKYMKQNPVLGDIYDLLESQFRRLSKPEQSLMYWLAINREPVSIEELQEDLVQTNTEELKETRESLIRKAIIEISDGEKLSLQNVVWEYVIKKFVEQIVQEITKGAIELLNSNALIKAQADENIREIQSRNILEPVLHKLQERLGSANEIKSQLKEILSDWRTNSLSEPGYLAGNLLNFLCHLKRESQEDIDLSNLDFSHLTVWQANLQNVDLPGVNFAYSELKNCIFTETFGSILSVAISPDGQWLAAGDIDNRVLLWQVADGKPKRPFQDNEHTNWIWSVAFSPDSKMLASGSEDQTVKLWDVETGDCLKTLLHSSWVRAVAFSPDGKTLASGSEDQTVRLWDVNDVVNDVNHVVNADKCKKTLKGHSSWVRAVAFSPDGKTLASGSEDQTVRLWNVETGEFIGHLEGHTKSVSSVSFSPNGKTLASGSEDRTVRLWNVETGQCLKILEGHSKWVRSVAFSPAPDSEILASGSEDKTVRLWDVETGKCLEILEGHENWIWSVTFSGDGKTLASGSEDKTVRLWDIDTGENLYTLQGYNNWVLSIAFHPQGEKIASGHEDKKVRIWNLATGKCQTLPGHTNRVRSVAFSPDGQTLASGSEDQTVKLWDVDTGSYLCTLKGHENPVRSVAFDPNGKILASASTDKTIKLWDAKTREYIRTLEGHTNRVWSIAFSPDGQKIASGSDDKTMRLWDVETGECLKILEGHENWVRSVAFSPDGQKIASGSDDKTVKLWDAKTGECLDTLKGHENWIRSVAFSPDGQILASGSADEKVKLWDVNTGQCLKTLEGHENWIRSVVFSPDGQMLASGSADETIRFWDVNTGKEIRMPLRSKRPYEGMNITGIKGDMDIVILKALGAVEKRVKT